MHTTLGLNIRVHAVLTDNKLQEVMQVLFRKKPVVLKNRASMTLYAAGLSRGSDSCAALHSTLIHDQLHRQQHDFQPQVPYIIVGPQVQG